MDGSKGGAARLQRFRISCFVAGVQQQAWWPGRGVGAVAESGPARRLLGSGGRPGRGLGVLACCRLGAVLAVAGQLGHGGAGLTAFLREVAAGARRFRGSWGSAGRSGSAVAVGDGRRAGWSVTRW